MGERVPKDVLELLRQRVDSLEQLEALLLLRGEPARRWAIDEIAHRLSLPGDQLEPALDELVASGLLARAGRALETMWWYAPRDPQSAATSDRLAEVYAVHKLEVLRLMSDLAVQRIRGSAARAFADAFVIGRKKDG